MTTRRAVLAGVIGAAVAGATAHATGAFASPSGPGRSADRTRRGPLVLVGGGLADDNAAVYGEIVRRAGGPQARIGVLTAASVPPSQDPDAGTPDASNSVANGAFYRDLLLSYGAGTVEYIPIDLDNIANSDDPALAEHVAQMTGFFFGGGDQFRYITCLLHGDENTDSAVMAAIRHAHDHGAVIAGSSAGADIQQGLDMVTGGDSYPALRDGTHPGYFDDPAVSGYWPAGGFGFFNSALLDTHFNAYGRLGRGITLARAVGRHRFVGIDPDTAFVVDHPGTRGERARIIGTAGVSILELDETVRWSYLTNGYGYTAGTSAIHVSPDVRPLHPSGPQTPVPPNPDIFGDYQELDLALALAAAHSVTAVGRTAETGPQFEVVLDKTRDFRAYTRDGVTADSFRSIAVRIRTVSA